MIDIRPAEKNDVETIANIINSAWKVTYKNIVPDIDLIKYTDDTRREKQITEYMDIGAPEFFVAKLNSKDCGIVSYKEYDSSDFEDCAYIMQLYVHPDFQKKGVGKALMKYISNLAKEKGYKRIVLNTLEKNSNARAFYEKLGYKFFGTEISPLFCEEVVRALYKKEL